MIIIDKEYYRFLTSLIHTGSLLCCSVSGERRPNRKHTRFPWWCNNLQWKLGALLRPKIETRKFTLEVFWFSMKKKVRQQKLAGKVDMVVFFDSWGLIYQRAVSENRYGVLLWSTATVAAAYSNEEAELKHQWILHHDNA